MIGVSVTDKNVCSTNNESENTFRMGKKAIFVKPQANTQISLQSGENIFETELLLAILIVYVFRGVYFKFYNLIYLTTNNSYL
jgi:hypothetical protein